MKTLTGTKTRTNTLILAGLLAVVCSCSVHTQQHSKFFSPFIWPSKPPADCPFEKSGDIVGIAFTGRHITHTHADTWYLSWASDGNMYSPFADGNIGEMEVWCGGAKARTVHAKIIGDDPLNLQVVPLGTYPGSATPYDGRYLCANLVYNGIWYYGTNVESEGPPGSILSPQRTLHVEYKGMWFDYPWLGPLVGFRISKDLGKTWIDIFSYAAKTPFGRCNSAVM